LVSFKLLGQNQGCIEITYKVRSNNLIDTQATVIERKNEFHSSRCFLLKETQLIDSHILCSSDSSICSIIFRKDTQNNWFIFINKKWVKFYNSRGAKINPIEKKNFYILPTNRQKLIGTKKIYEFIIKTESRQGGESVTYWFDPNFGIIAIEGSSFALVREDW
jgi:hypothetical protein